MPFYQSVLTNTSKINVVIFCTDRSIPAGSVEIPAHKWVTPAAKQEVLDAYEDCGSEVQTLLSLIPNPSKWSVHAVDPPLTSYVKGQIALVGDAAHGMCPHLGAGVGQGFEDALLLCKLLTHPGTASTNLQVRVYPPLGLSHTILLGHCHSVGCTARL